MSGLSGTVSEKDARAAADLADWLKDFDLGEVIVLHSSGKERFRVRWDKGVGISIRFPQPAKEAP